MITLCLLHKKEKEKCGLKKNVKIVSKKIIKKNHQMKNLLLKCIEIFHIYIYIYNFEIF